MMSLATFSRRAYLLAAVTCVNLPSPGNCTEPKKSETGKAIEAVAQASDVKEFCVNNAATAGSARIAWQTSKLLDLEGQIKQHLEALEARKAELIELQRMRDEAINKAKDEVVAIYAHMKPDAAAALLAAMDDSMAVAILTKLSVRAASTILNEMEPARASQLTRSMIPPGGKRS